MIFKRVRNLDDNDYTKKWLKPLLGILNECIFILDW